MLTTETAAVATGSSNCKPAKQNDIALVQPTSRNNHDVQGTAPALNHVESIAEELRMPRRTTIYEALISTFEAGAIFFLQFMLTIAKTTLRLLAVPIALALASCLCIVTFRNIPPFIRATLSENLSPICTTPILSILPICNQTWEPPAVMHGLPYRELVRAQERFVSIAAAVGPGTYLAVEFDDAGMAVDDLSTLIRLSNLANKEKLAKSMDQFVVLAHQASKKFTRLKADIGGALESVIAVDEYVITSLEAIEHSEKQRGFLSNAMAQFIPPISIEKELARAFNQALDLTDSEVIALRRKAKETEEVLEDLHSKLEMIEQVLKRETGNSELKYEQALAELWTRIGANRAKLTNFTRNLRLLKHVDSSRLVARKSVSIALTQLLELVASLANLRKSIVGPVMGQVSNIPFGTHLSVMRAGVKKMQEELENAQKRDGDGWKVIHEGRQYPELEMRWAFG